MTEATTAATEPAPEAKTEGSSTLELDRSDSGVNDLVSQWEDGGEYEVKMKIRQVSHDDNRASYEVLGIESEDEGEGGEAAPGKKPMGKPAIMIAFHK